MNEAMREAIRRLQWYRRSQEYDDRMSANEIDAELQEALEALDEVFGEPKA